MTEEEIMNLVTELGGIMQALKDADPVAGNDHVRRDVSEGDCTKTPWLLSVEFSLIGKGAR
jgi:hypothetical protein